MAAMLLTLSGCKTKQIVEQKPVTDAITAATKTVAKEAPAATLSIEAPQPTVTYDDAVNWARDRITPLINKYRATSGNKLDPDEMRKMFAKAKTLKPKACRVDSFETYLIGLDRL